MPATDLIPAFVLHARRYGDNHLLLDVLTLSSGRLSVMARGAGAPGSRRRGLLQPFVPLLISWAGRGQIANLRQAEARGRYRLPVGNALYSGFYLNELLLRLVEPGEPLPALFIAYEKCLEYLTGAGDLETALRQFELQLLATLGYGVDLVHEGETGNQVQAGLFYVYETEKGLRAARTNDSLAVSGATLLALSEGCLLEGDQRQEARRLMRQVIGYYLGDRPLRSRELFRAQLNQENH